MEAAKKSCEIRKKSQKPLDSVRTAWYTVLVPDEEDKRQEAGKALIKKSLDGATNTIKADAPPPKRP